MWPFFVFWDGSGTAYLVWNWARGSEPGDACESVHLFLRQAAHSDAADTSRSSRMPDKTVHVASVWRNRPEMGVIPCVLPAEGACELDLYVHDGSKARRYITYKLDGDLDFALIKKDFRQYQLFSFDLLMRPGGEGGDLYAPEIEVSQHNMLPDMGEIAKAWAPVLAEQYGSFADVNVVTSNVCVAKLESSSGQGADYTLRISPAQTVNLDEGFQIDVNWQFAVTDLDEMPAETSVAAVLQEDGRTSLVASLQFSGPESMVPYWAERAALFIADDHGERAADVLDSASYSHSRTYRQRVFGAVAEELGFSPAGFETQDLSFPGGQARADRWVSAIPVSAAQFAGDDDNETQSLSDMRVADIPLEGLVPGDRFGFVTDTPSLFHLIGPDGQPHVVRDTEIAFRYLVNEVEILEQRPEDRTYLNAAMAAANCLETGSWTSAQGRSNVGLLSDSPAPGAIADRLDEAFAAMRTFVAFERPASRTVKFESPLALFAFFFALEIALPSEDEEPGPEPVLPDYQTYIQAPAIFNLVLNCELAGEVPGGARSLDMPPLLALLVIFGLDDRAANDVLSWSGEQQANFLALLAEPGTGQDVGIARVPPGPLESTEGVDSYLQQCHDLAKRLQPKPLEDAIRLLKPDWPEDAELLRSLACDVSGWRSAEDIAQIKALVTRAEDVTRGEQGQVQDFIETIFKPVDETSRETPMQSQPKVPVQTARERARGKYAALLDVLGAASSGMMPAEEFYAQSLTERAWQQVEEEIDRRLAQFKAPDTLLRIVDHLESWAGARAIPDRYFDARSGGGNSAESRFDAIKRFMNRFPDRTAFDAQRWFGTSRLQALDERIQQDISRHMDPIALGADLDTQLLSLEELQQYARILLCHRTACELDEKFALWQGVNAQVGAEDDLGAWLGTQLHALSWLREAVPDGLGTLLQRYDEFIAEVQKQERLHNLAEEFLVTDMHWRALELPAR